MRNSHLSRSFGENKMRSLSIFSLLLLMGLQGAPAPAENPCTNGSFEQLDAQGIPVDWSPVSPLSISNDARGGHNSLRIVRDRTDAGTEAGVNRAWVPENGQRGAMIDRLKGGMEFWYKAISSHGAQMNVGVIPMNQRPYEETHASRALFDIPPQHIGDGLWHRARLKYDYSQNTDVKWVHFAARITGGTGEFLLDEVSYLEEVGPNLVIDTLWIDEEPTQPGLAGTLRTRIRNTGDQDASQVQITCLPSSQIQGIVFEPPRILLSQIKVGQIENIRFRLLGKRADSGMLTMLANAENLKASEVIRIAPQMKIESFGPVSPVVIQGTESRVECLVKNSGNAFLIKPQAAFEVNGKEAKVSLPWIPPGDSAVLSATLNPATETLQSKISVELTSQNCGGTLNHESSVTVVSSESPSTDGTGLLAHQDSSGWIIGNEKVRLIARNNSYGISPIEIQGQFSSVWKTVAWLPTLGRVVLKNSGGGREVHPLICSPESATAAVADSQQAVFSLKTGFKDADGSIWSFSSSFTLGEDLSEIAVQYHLECDRPRELLAFDGPMVYALERDEAVFPGLEWLVDGEISSSDLDINQGHPHQTRYVVHPNMVTIPAVGVHSSWGTLGLIWDIKQKWDGERDRPGVVFASPDRFNHQRSHLAGLMIPTVPEFVKMNQREAFNPYPLAAGRSLAISCSILVQADAADPLTAIDAWSRHYGFPEPEPLPHGSYDQEIQFSMRGYLESLWDADSQKWWTSKSGPESMSFLDRPQDYIGDLLLGAIRSPDPEVKARCLERARQIQSLRKDNPGLKSADPVKPGEIFSEYYPAPLELAWTGQDRVGALLAGRDKQGGWRFDADFQDNAIFKGFDYHILGEDNAIEIGTCARNCTLVLRYALTSGDLHTFQSMLPTLEIMEEFRVPRAAQVWEVPVHTPDILAAADAIDAFLAAFRISSDPRWLKDAVDWARRGLPFVYAWQEPKLPFVLGATIPVFGASLRNYSWFGLPVQWNGLRYAEALLDLADVDDSYPWRRIAELILRSAIRQQAPDGPDAALWPDNTSAIDGARCPWVFSPRQIIQAIMKFEGNSLSPVTHLLHEGEALIPVTTAGALSDLKRHGEQVSFKVTYPEGLESQVLLANLSRPSQVLVDGHPLPEAPTHKETLPGGCWRYNPDQGFLILSIPKSGASLVQIDGCRYASFERIAALKTSIDFSFDQGTDGWLALNDIENLTTRNGFLSGEISGNDPYMIRSFLKVDGDKEKQVEIKLKLASRSIGQLYWTTENSPDIREDKVASFEIQGGSQVETIRVDLAHHPHWKGQTITSIRLDPCNGLGQGSFEIDSIRAIKD